MNYTVPEPPLPSGIIRPMLARRHHFYTNPYLLLTLTALFWSGNMVLGRGIRADVPPLALAFWRWSIAFGLVLPLALPHLRAQWPLLKAGWKPVLLLGLIGVGGYNTFAYIALQYTSATNAVLLNSFIPIVTIAVSWGFLGKHLSRQQAIGWWEQASGLRADPTALHWWELFSCIKGQAIWLSAARAFERGDNSDLLMAFAAWMLSNSQDRAVLELMGHLP